MPRSRRSAGSWCSETTRGATAACRSVPLRDRLHGARTEILILAVAQGRSHRRRHVRRCRARPRNRRGLGCRDHPASGARTSRRDRGRPGFRGRRRSAPNHRRQVKPEPLRSGRADRTPRRAPRAPLVWRTPGRPRDPEAPSPNATWSPQARTLCSLREPVRRRRLAGGETDRRGYLRLRTLCHFVADQLQVRTPRRVVSTSAASQPHVGRGLA
jgi:hypothetical protein